MPSSSGGNEVTSGDAPSQTPFVNVTGRADWRDPAGPRFAWPATEIQATFTGTGIDVRLGDTGTNFFAVRIDDGTPTSVATARGTARYTLASTLTPGRHTVALTKRTESNVGVVQFLGFLPHDGVLVKDERPSPDSPRRIEFIGDSVTCGYGNLGTDPEQHFSSDAEDETLAYGALTAAQLGAEHTAIAYSGIGMYRNYSGSTLEPMPLRFLRTLADDRTSVWTFSTPAPDVVVVALGGNDFATGDPGSAFTDAYVEFVRRLRTLYPRAFVVCALSPLLSDAHPVGALHRTKAKAYLRAAVQKIRSDHSENRERVSYFEFSELQPSEGFGSDHHPSAASHRRMAGELVTFLRATLKW